MAQQAELMNVKYIGKREPWYDRNYGSGLSFNCKQTRALPWNIARKLLRHSDLFEEVKGKAEDADKAEKTDKSPVEPATVDDPSKTEDDTQALIDEQEAKDKAELAKQNEIQNMRDQVGLMDKATIEQFALERYQHKFPSKTTLPKMREAAVSLIDQYEVM